MLGTPCGSRARHCKVLFLSQYICGGHSSETGVVLSAETVLEEIFIFPDKDLETACLYQSIFAFDISKLGLTGENIYLSENSFSRGQFGAKCLADGKP